MLHNAIFITGAGQRIGFYLAEAFLQQGQYPVVFTYRTFRPGVQALLDQGAIGFQVDLSDAAAVQHFIVQLKTQVGSLRALIHNASAWHQEHEGVDMANALDEMLAVHVRAPYALNMACAPLLRQASTATADIIHITDANVDRGSAHQIAYLASKSALHSMTQSFAKALAPHIKVNEIQPGLVIFNEDDSDAYRAKRLAEMAIPIEPGADIVWQMVQTVLHLPNTTGVSFPLANG